MTLPFVQQLAEFFQTGNEAVVCGYLFGSMARGEPRKNSDTDVAVLYRHSPIPGFDAAGVPLAGELERLLGKPVDVVVMNSAPVDLIHRILRDGILIFDRDPLFRVRFEVVARSKYLDLKPILDRYRRAV